MLGAGSLKAQACGEIAQTKSYFDQYWLDITENQLLYGNKIPNSGRRPKRQTRKRKKKLIVIMKIGTTV